MAAKVYKVNVQQQPKVEGLLSCFRARTGHKLIQLDFNSIEDVVLAEASEDESLMKIYRVDHNCGYLFIGAGLGVDSISTPILKYYDPENPTAAGVAAAKKNCKPERKACKTVKLAAAYGAWPKTIRKRLDAAKFPVTQGQAEAIFTNYWEMFNGVKRFEEALRVEWRNNKGWFFNGTGRPIPMCDDKAKRDLVNSYCQSTAHDLLMMYNHKINCLRHERKVLMYPWLPDWHDETMWEAPDAHVQNCKEILEESLVYLNEKASGILPIKGEVCIADNLWIIKDS